MARKLPHRQSYIDRKRKHKLHLSSPTKHGRRYVAGRKRGKYRRR